MLCLGWVQVDYLARYMRGWRITQHSLYGGLFVHELHPLPFGGLQVSMHPAFACSAVRDAQGSVM